MLVTPMSQPANLDPVDLGPLLAGGGTGSVTTQSGVLRFIRSELKLSSSSAPTPSLAHVASSVSIAARSLYALTDRWMPLPQKDPRLEVVWFLSSGSINVASPLRLDQSTRI
jgi:hypothetical protein